METRRYIKRVWRVPKERGALEFFATLVVKALVKHGWPAVWHEEPSTGGFVVLVQGQGEEVPPDFAEAVGIAARVTARLQRVQIEHHKNWIALAKDYYVARGGHLREVKIHDLSGTETYSCSGGGAALCGHQDRTIRRYEAA